MSAERERDVIGAGIIDADALHTAMEHLGPDSFFSETHREIFRTMVDLEREGKSVDLVTVIEALGDKADPVYITGCAEQIYSTAVAESAVLAVAEDYRRRESRRVYGDALRRVTDGEDIPDVAAWVDTEMTGILDQSAKGGLTHIAEIGAERWAEYEYMRDNPSIVGIPTAFGGIDGILGGLQRGEMHTLAARPGVGKSAMAINLAAAVAEQGYRVAFYSLEMSRKSLFDRGMAWAANVNVQSLRLGKTTRWTEAEEGFAKLAGYPIYINDDRAITTAQIRAQCRRLYKRDGLDLLIVDYLGLLRDRPEHGEQRHTQIGRMCKALRGMLKDFDGALLLLHQLNRASEQERRKPRLSDLRESGDVEQDSDVVMFLHPGEKIERPESNPPKPIELIIAKNRHGPTGVVNLMFEESRTRFVETTGRYG